MTNTLPGITNNLENLLKLKWTQLIIAAILSHPVDEGTYKQNMFNLKLKNQHQKKFLLNPNL